MDISFNMKSGVKAAQLIKEFKEVQFLCFGILMLSAHYDGYNCVASELSDLYSSI